MVKRWGRRRRILRKRSKLLARRARGPAVRRGAPSVHRFKEMCPLLPLTAPVLGGVGLTRSVKFNDLTNQASFKALFDLYKINGVKFTFIYKANISDPTGGGAVGATNALPVLYIATNRDPFVPAPTSAADVMNDDTCKVYRLGGYNKIEWYVKTPKPDMTITVPGQGGGPNYTVPYNFQFGERKAFQPWLTTGGNAQTLDQSSVEHYGIRMWLDNTNGSASQSVDVFATLYFSLKEQD